MNSHITDKFQKAFAELPADVQKQARQAYRLFIENPHHPSLRFKPIHPTRPITLYASGRIIVRLAFARGVTLFGIGLAPMPNIGLSQSRDFYRPNGNSRLFYTKIWCFLLCLQVAL